MPFLCSRFLPVFGSGGSMGENSISSYAARWIYSGCWYSRATYGVYVGYGTSGYSGGSYVGWLSGAQMLPSVPGANPGLSSNYDWRTDIVSVPLDGDYSIPFAIAIYNGTSKYKWASGSLTPQYLSVVGPPCQTPIGETTTWDKWGPPGSSITVGGWRQTLVALDGTTTFPSGTVTEVDAGGGTDSCYIDSIDRGQVKPMYTVTGNGAPIISNQWGDAVGYDSGSVGYYRSHNRVPCGFTLYQQMQYQCSDGSWVNYGPVNVLQSTIYATRVTSTRAGQTCSSDDITNCP